MEVVELRGVGMSAVEVVMKEGIVVRVVKEVTDDAGHLLSLSLYYRM